MSAENAKPMAEFKDHCRLEKRREQALSGHYEPPEDHMSHLEEPALIQRAQAGDREAYAALIETYWNVIYGQLLGMTRNTHAAEDLTQDVFLKAWAKLKSFTTGTHFRAWLARIGRNAFLNSRRDRRMTTSNERIEKSLIARDPSPMAVLASRETQSMVEAETARLPPTSQAAFWMRTRDELPFLEVGRALRITAATARWHVFQARQTLQKRLQPMRKECIL